MKEIKKNNVKRELFIQYLESLNKYEDLYLFGFHNKIGFRENRRIPFLDNLILEKYDKNKDITYLEYANYIKSASLRMIIIFFCIFILFCVFIALVDV